MLELLPVGLALGALAAGSGLSYAVFVRRARLRESRWAHFDAPGAVWTGSGAHFERAALAMFPGAPEGSWVGLGPYVDNWHCWATGETGFFVLAPSASGNPEMYAAELRLSARMRDSVARAEALAADLDAGFTREDRADGAVVLRTAQLRGLDELLAAAREFTTGVLRLPRDGRLHVQWHCATQSAVRGRDPVLSARAAPAAAVVALRG